MVGDNKSENLKLVESFVLRSFKKINCEKRIKHFNRTLYWTGVLKPDASEALQIASLGYELGDVYKEQNPFLVNGSSNNAESIDFHQKEGALKMKKFLEDNGFSESVSKKVHDIIAGHETGEGPEHKILRDADRINYFENIALRRSRASGMISPESIKNEFQKMFKDISSPKAKELAEPFYKKAMTELMRK